MPEEEAPRGEVVDAARGIIRRTRNLNANASFGHLNVYSVSFGKDPDMCPVCMEKITESKPKKLVEHLDNNSTQRVLIHSKCWEGYLKLEKAHIIIKKYLWEKHEVVPNEDQMKVMENKLELAEHIQAGKEIEWEFFIRYCASINASNVDEAHSFVAGNKDYLEYEETIWTPIWRLKE